MAAADYRLCDVCNGKAFYDSNLNYEDHREAPDREPYKVAGEASDWGYRLGYLGDWAVLCRDCSKTHQTRIINSGDAGVADAAQELRSMVARLMVVVESGIPDLEDVGDYQMASLLLSKIEDSAA